MDTIVQQQIARSFSAACDSYDSAARLQRMTAQGLLRLQSPANKIVLDMGCGTGENSQNLLTAAQLYAFDLCWQMADKTQQRLQPQQASARCFQADVLQLPLQANSIELAYSNLMLQWLDDLTPALQQIHQVLVPGGQLLFSTLLPGTLQQLADAWAQVDNDQHVNQFLPLEQLLPQLQAAGFEVKYQLEPVELTYPTVKAVAQELKTLGANYVKQRQHKGLTGKGKWQAMVQAYHNYQLADGQFPASFQVAYIKATKQVL